MKKRLLIFSVVLALVISLAFTGCGSNNNDNSGGNNTTNGDTGEKADNQIFRYAVWSSPPGLFNSSLATDVYDGYVNDLMYEGMIQLNPELKYEMNLAEKYVVSDDNLEITFYLRKDVKWHDGEEFTAEDVKFTFEACAHPDYSGPRYSNFEKVKGAKEYHDGEADSVEGIEVIDKNTIKITLSEVYAPALGDIGAFAIIPKHIWSEIPVGDWATATDTLRNPIGTGPFKFKAYEPDQYVEFARYDDYHKGPALLEKVFINVANQDTVQAQLIAGEVDFAPIAKMNKDDIDYYKDNNIKIKEITSRGYQYMGINNRLDMFKDKRARQALAMAINRQGMVDGIMEGYGVVAHAPFASFSWALPKTGLNEYKFNTKEAKKLIASVDGYEYKGDKLYFNGEPMKISLKYPTGNKVREASAPLIQQNLKAIGIDVELLIMEFGTLIDQAIDKQEFELYLMGWGLSADPDSTGIWHSQYTKLGGWNTCGFVNDKSDELLGKGTNTLDQNEREKIYNEWATLLNDEVPTVFLYSMIEGRAFSPKIVGLELYPFSDFYNIHKWYIAK